MGLFGTAKRGRKTIQGSPPPLKALEEIEQECIPGLVEVLRWEGIEAVRYALFDMTNWHADYDPCICRNRATEEQKRVSWEMWVRMEKILAVVLHEAYNQQADEAMAALSEGPERFCGKVIQPPRDEGTDTD